MKYSIEELKEVLKGYLSEYRYNHSICVMEKAKEYLNIFAPNDKELYEKTIRAALMHDVCKEFSEEESKEYIEKNSIDVSLDDVALVHGILGADLCSKLYDFTPDMAKAIYWHTTGCVDMSLMDKIVFLADKTGRDNLSDDLKRVDDMSKVDLDKAIIMYLEIVFDKLKSRNLTINENSIKLYELLKK